MSDDPTHVPATSARLTPGAQARRAWLLALLLGAGASLSAMPLAGDDETEREQLARIVHEIERLEVMVASAAQTAPTGQRVRFRYDWLQNDLRLLRMGITEHTDAPRQPRPVPPLRGDYRQ